MLSVYIEYKVVCTAHVSLILHVLDLLIHTVFTGKHRGRSLKWCCLLVGEPSKISTFISPYYSHCSIRSTSRLYRWLSIRRRVYIHDGMAPCIQALAHTLSKCSTPFFSFPYLFFLPRRIGMKIEFICLWQEYTDNYYDVAGVVVCAVYPQAEIDFTNANNKTGCNAQEWWSCLPWFYNILKIERWLKFNCGIPSTWVQLRDMREAPKFAVVAAALRQHDYNEVCRRPVGPQTAVLHVT